MKSCSAFWDAHFLVFMNNVAYLKNSWEKDMALYPSNYRTRLLMYWKFAKEKKTHIIKLNRKSDKSLQKQNTYRSFHQVLLKFQEERRIINKSYFLKDMDLSRCSVNQFWWESKWGGATFCIKSSVPLFFSVILLKFTE